MLRTSSLAFALALALGGGVAHARPSNPAFLGVGMQDAGGARGAGPCQITEVTKDSGAETAGVRTGDLVLAVDGTAVATCDALLTAIQARVAGDVIRLELRRPGELLPVQVAAQLLSRDEVLRRRFVGQPVPRTALVRVDDRATTDLSAAARKTTIVGWFTGNCEGCDRVLGGVARWAAAASTRGAPIVVLGATLGSPYKTAEDNLDELRLLQRTLEVPLLYAEREIFEQFAINDADRVHFMVIDGRGIVQYVAPIAPRSDDADAAFDELIAAAQQATRRPR